MKRITCCFLAAVLLLALAAFGKNEAAGAPGNIIGLAQAAKGAASAGETGEDDSVFPRHSPYGVGRGTKPGRVVWSYEPDGVEWDGSGYWWELSHFDEAVIQRAVDGGIAALAGMDSAEEGWAALFQAHNAERGRQGGYSNGQKIAIKVNMNGAGAYSDDQRGETQESYTNPVLLRALLISLVTDAGVEPKDITVYDAGRIIPDYVRELCSRSPLEGVQFRYRDLGGPNDAEADRNAPVIWSQSVSGEVNYLPACVTEADYLINLANLKGHVYGITLCAKNHYGSLMNSNRMRAPEAAGIHRYLTQNRMDAYTVLVDLMANEQLGGKTVLYMLDAIICAPGESVSITGENARWQQEPFFGDYTSSVFFSQDPVAIDSVGADFLMNEPTVTSRNSALRDNPNVENYLHEAALAPDAPSGASYLNGSGERTVSLGVHEHWNNSVNKQYSRNLGEGEGIELVRIGAGSSHSDSLGPSDPLTAFTDVAAGVWYEEAVEYCTSHGLMSGTEAEIFSPEGITTRGMLVTILHRQSGRPASSSEMRFSDVEAGQWFGDAVAWAAENGIISGYTDGSFRPDEAVSREQIAAVLWRFAGSPKPSGSAAAFADQSFISTYASDAVAWAREAGLMTGKGENRFDPKAPVTRAETAVMFYNHRSR